MNDAIRVELTRSVTESVHLVDAVAVTGGEIVASWGDPDAPVIPRSAIKSIQALPLLESGAADAFEVTEVELALAIASHSGEPAHVEAVDKWLRRLDLTRDDLECGADRPIGLAAADEVLRSGHVFERIHNCCSGKHAGFLTIARHLDIDPTGYIEPNHPVQKLVAEAVSSATGLSFEDQAPGIDGCGIPTYSMPVSALAHAIGSLTDPHDVNRQRILHAGNTHPWWVSGTGRHEVTLIDAANEPMMLKTGAEGVFVAALPDRQMGIACKARDGATRAAEVAITWILHELQAISGEPLARPIMNRAGDLVGQQRVATR